MSIKYANIEIINVHVQSWITFIDRTTNRKQTMSSYLAIRTAYISLCQFQLQLLAKKRLKYKY